MRRALLLAAPGVGRTGANPSVGCVIVSDGVVVGEGATAPGGRPHAEELALLAAGANARGATAYVTLEPCAKRSSGAASCSSMLVEAGISRVVFAAEDPHPFAAGVGTERLRAAGIVVEAGLLGADVRSALVSFFSQFNDLDVYRANAAARVEALTELAPLVTRLQGIDCFASGWNAESEGLTKVSVEPRMSIFRDANGREWWVFDEAGSVIRVEVDLATAPLSKTWSGFDEDENLRAWIGCFYDAQAELERILGEVPNYIGYMEDEGFPQDEDVLYLARWQDGATRFMLQFGGVEYFGHPDERFRLCLVSSCGDFSRELSRLSRARKIKPQ